MKNKKTNPTINLFAFLSVRKSRNKLAERCELLVKENENLKQIITELQKSKI